MSLTSYRAAPPRVGDGWFGDGWFGNGWFGDGCELRAFMGGRIRAGLVGVCCIGYWYCLIACWYCWLAGLVCRPGCWVGGGLVCGGRVGGPGGDLLSRALGHSTMGAGDFHGRVRDGIGCGLPAMTTRSSSPSQSSVFSRRFSVVSCQMELTRTGLTRTDLVGWWFWCLLRVRRLPRTLGSGGTEDDFHAWCASLPLVTCFLTTDDCQLTTVS
jgi:hypothetical protein